MASKCMNLESLESFEELCISHQCLEENEKYFASVVGCIEDVLMSEEFVELHEKFMEDHWQDFEEGEENKLIYYDIFKKYTASVEKYIEEKLVNEIPEFDMLEFEHELGRRQNELDGEIFEILLTFSDFVSFKDKFLDYKAMKEGRTVDFSNDFSVVTYRVDN